MSALNRKTARNLIRGLQKGTIRPGGAKYIHCGHENWLSAQLEELDEIKEDEGAIVHFVRGAYGEGKTHFLNYIEELARERGWATTHLECRQDTVELDRFETLYPKIIQKLRLVPDLLENKDEITEDPAYTLLDLWGKKLLESVGFTKNYVGKPFEAEAKIFKILQTKVMRRNLNGDLQRVLCAYPRAILQEDYNSQNDMVAWLKGQKEKIHIPASLLSKPGQRIKAPGVDKKLLKATVIRPITTGTSLEIFRGIIWLLKECGYNGLILSIDEVEQIARMKYRKRREQSLQVLREFVDNTDSDIGLQSIAIYFAATPNMFDDEQYFRSYDALATRIEAVSNEINWRAPVIDLERTMLTKEQLTHIASKIKEIFECAYPPSSYKAITVERLHEIVDAVSKSKYRIAKPRLLCRSIVDQLERTRQGQSLKDTTQLISKTANILIKENE